MMHADGIVTVLPTRGECMLALFEVFLCAFERSADWTMREEHVGTPNLGARSGD